MYNIKVTLYKLKSIELFNLFLSITNIISNLSINRIIKLTNMYNVDFFYKLYEL